MKNLLLILLATPFVAQAMNLEMNGKTNFKYSKHSLDRLEERNIQKDEIRLAVRQGKLFPCTEPDTYVCNTSNDTQVIMSYNSKRNEVTIITAYKAVNGKFPENILTNNLTKKELAQLKPKRKKPNAPKKNKNIITQEQFDNL